MQTPSVAASTSLTAPLHPPSHPEMEQQLEFPHIPGVPVIFDEAINDQKQHHVSRLVFCYEKSFFLPQCLTHRPPALAKKAHHHLHDSPYIEVRLRQSRSTSTALFAPNFLTIPTHVRCAAVTTAAPLSPFPRLPTLLHPSHHPPIRPPSSMRLSNFDPTPYCLESNLDSSAVPA